MAFTTISMAGQITTTGNFFQAYEAGKDALKKPEAEGDEMFNTFLMGVIGVPEVLHLAMEAQHAVAGDPAARNNPGINPNPAMQPRPEAFVPGANRKRQAEEDKHQRAHGFGFASKKPRPH